MHLLIFFSFLVSTVLAMGREFPPWTPPSSSDVRSPCPALNTIANHGIIPHNGRGLTIRMLQKALGDTYNIGLDLSTAFAIGGLFTSPHPFKGSFDLSDLKKHNFIEHDASLSRADLGISGDAVIFRPEIWEGVVDTYDGMVNTTLEMAAMTRAKRIAQAKAQNLGINFGFKPKLLSYGETALYLSAMGGSRGLKKGEAPVEWINIWFSEERLPVAEGWTPSSSSINGLSLNILVAKLAWATESGVRWEPKSEKMPSGVSEKEL